MPDSPVTQESAEVGQIEVVTSAGPLGLASTDRTWEANHDPGKPSRELYPELERSILRQASLLKGGDQ